MSASRTFTCLLALGSVLAAGCEPPPEEEVGSSEFALAANVPSALLKYAGVFTVHAFRTQTTSKTAVSCSDIPKKYHIGYKEIDGALDPLKILDADNKEFVGLTNPNYNSSTATEIKKKLRIPAAAEFFLVVQAWAEDAERGTQYVIGRGCVDRLTLKEHVSKAIGVDVYSSIGAPCTSSAECDEPFTCGGGGSSTQFCAKENCTAGTCPHGSDCVSSPSGGAVCLALCDTTSDCLTASQSCQSRGSDTSAKVCVPFAWNTSTTSGS